MTASPIEILQHDAERRFRVIVDAGVIANHLRRTRGHRVDIAWLVQDRAYARYILALARRCGDAAIIQRAHQLEQWLFGRAP